MSTTKRIALNDTYLQLVKQFPLIPIKDEHHYDAAVAYLKKLAIRDESSLDDGESAYLDALSLFVEDYQDKRHQIRRTKA